MWIIYLLIGTMHFMQLREANYEPGLTAAELPLWLRAWYHIHHLGVYATLSWNVLAIALLTAACELAFSLTVLDILSNLLFRGWRARQQERLRRVFARLRGVRRSLLYAAAVLLFSAGTVVWFAVFVSLVNHLQYDFNTLMFLGRSAHPAVGLSPSGSPCCRCSSSRSAAR